MAFLDPGKTVRDIALRRKISPECVGKIGPVGLAVY
jgi:hypothetical protein